VGFLALAGAIGDQIEMFRDEERAFVAQSVH
jgi:hypothetical protein